ncbi:DNA polymerase III subunit beta [Vaginisenegalia massiliensis]|uniref:DNA polymerase III subunit beta n=1 Tax=Vaginisenegalia massiliensis TaxID=2058294 RepID=UPI000F521943|nr:DNA polymerase III subunit beta [Vaginisenegalia massiliensis]
MKFTIQRQALINQLSHVTRAISSKATIPVLTGIKVTASHQGLTLIGSDADISIESYLPQADDQIKLTIEKTGSIVLPARLFNEVIKKLPTPEVTIEVNENFLATISSGTVVFEINGVDGQQYPQLPEISSDQKIALPTLLFKQMINQTVFATSNQESRPILTGINFSLKVDQLSAVATDSHRLSKRTIPLNQNELSLTDQTLTIPKKTMIELSRIVEDNQELYMTLMAQQVIFTVDNLTIYSRLLEGNYPETDRLIPNSHQTELIVNANEFLAAIDRASLMAHEGKNNVVQLEIDDQKVELSVQGNEAGHLAEEIAYQLAEGDAIKISFNPDYMKDALKSFGDVDVKIGFQSPVRPLLLSAVVEQVQENNQLLQLLTPIRTH